MNVGIVIIQAHEGMREKFETAAKQGFKHCQLVSWDVTTWTEESVDVIKGLCEEFGIEITAFWCGWVGPKRWNFTEGPETLGIVPVAYYIQYMRNAPSPNIRNLIHEPPRTTCQT